MLRVTVLFALAALASAVPEPQRVRPHPRSLDASVAAALAEEGRLLEAGKPELAKAKLQQALELLHRIQAADFEAPARRKLEEKRPKGGLGAAEADFEAARTSVLATLVALREEPSLLPQTSEVVQVHKQLLGRLAARKADIMFYGYTFGCGILTVMLAFSLLLCCAHRRALQALAVSVVATPAHVEHWLGAAAAQWHGTGGDAYRYAAAYRYGACGGTV